MPVSRITGESSLTHENFTVALLSFLQAHLLRINMGNIYFEQHKYPAAIKMYRMALDQVPLTSRSVRSKILRNIGVAFMRVGQYQVFPHRHSLALVPYAKSGMAPK